MEALIVASILGTGYYISNLNGNNQENKTKERKATKPKRKVRFSQNNETQTLKEGFENEIAVPKKENQYSYVEAENKEDDVFVSMSGQKIKKGDFVHNNMVPFFSGSVKQNLSASANQTLLDYHTGAASLEFSKKEIAPLFRTDRKNVGLPIGAPNKTAEMKEYIATNLNQVVRKNNELPFEQIRTGPGLNKGFTNKPSGGFNQPEKNEILKRYMNVDELRTENNPKQTYKGRVLPAKSVNTNRGKVGDVRKYKPDSYFINENGERNLVTTGAQIKDRVRPQPIDRYTTRPETSTEYYGAGGGNRDQIAGQVFNKDQYDHTQYNIKQLNEVNKGPAHSKDGWKQLGESKGVGDYGRGGFQNKPTERTFTGPRMHGLNITRDVKSVIAPLLDIFRPTKKQNMVGAARPFGNFGNTAPSARVYYDPNDSARTTIREITGRTDYLGAPTNVDQHEMYYYDPVEIAKPTIREVTANTNYVGIATNNAQNGQTGGGYQTANYVMEPTNRQTTQNHEYVGVAKSDDGPMSYTAEYNARLNPTKEIVAKGRTPTTQGPKTNLDSKQVNMSFKKHDFDYMQTRVPAPSNMATTIAGKEFIGEIKGKTVLNMNVARDRNVKDVVSQFENNKYAKPLNSMAPY